MEKYAYNPLGPGGGGCGGLSKSLLPKLLPCSIVKRVYIKTLYGDGARRRQVVAISTFSLGIIIRQVEPMMMAMTIIVVIVTITEEPLQIITCVRRHRGEVDFAPEMSKHSVTEMMVI